jgi:hypothetical protein
MRYSLLVAALAALALPGPTAAAEKVNLKVLYAGNPGSPRAKDFVAFLGQHFARVGETDYGKFSAEEAKGFDVVILDGTNMPPGGEGGKAGANRTGGSSWRSTRLSPDFDRPAVLVGTVGCFLTRPLRLKIDCL